MLETKYRRRLLKRPLKQLKLLVESTEEYLNSSEDTTESNKVIEGALLDIKYLLEKTKTSFISKQTARSSTGGYLKCK